MKYKKTILLLASLLFIICASRMCQKDEVEIIKASIPGIKNIFIYHFQLIEDVQQILISTGYEEINVFRGYYGEIRVSIKRGDGGSSLSDIFTVDERIKILELFSLESEGARIENMGRAGMGISSGGNRGYLAIANLEHDEVRIRMAEEESSYFEEIGDGWFAMIVLPPRS